MALTLLYAQVWSSASTEASDDPKTEGDPPVHTSADQLRLGAWQALCQGRGSDKAPSQQARHLRQIGEV